MSFPGRSSSGVRAWEWVFVVVLLLLAWGLRLCLLDDVPPGWRDDELINIHALSSQLLEGQFPIYYLGASGHEPLYHHLHAAIHAALGFNVLSGHILSVAFGLLSITLTYTLARRLFPTEPAIAAVATLVMTTSFWSLMYSRTAIRHISLLPLALATLYAFWRQIDASQSGVWGWGLTGFLFGATLYTYTASRLLPALLAVFAGYLALIHRDLFRRHWRGMAVACTVMALLAAPLGIAIAEGRTIAAIEGIGADARVTELAEPLRELRDGNLQPLFRHTWKTLGMFHATGDPEWLYNIAGRPVFNLLGGVLFWGAVGLCLYHWRRPRYVFLILWLGIGLSPAFISTPPASLSHTIFAQPAVYILPAVALVRVWRRRSEWARLRRTSAIVCIALLAFFVASTMMRDLRDYFLVWPRQEMVRVLYRADYRETAHYLTMHSEIQDVAVASTLLGPWDRLAVNVDTRHEDVDVRFFDPGRSLVWPAGHQRATVILTAWPPAHPIIEEVLRAQTSVADSLPSGLSLYDMMALDDVHNSNADSIFLALEESRASQGLHQFNNGLAFVGASWLDQTVLMPGEEAELITAWVVTEPLDLPPASIVANPPPPGVYAGPRLAVFAHLLTSDVQPEEALDQDRSSLAVDDGLWVDPFTLEPGDRFIQIHCFPIPVDPVVASYEVELGLYDPMTGNRWAILDADGKPTSDHVLIRDEDLMGVAVD